MRWVTSALARSSRERIQRSSTVRGLAAASVFGAIPGLVAKYWLADPETNTYGGVYLWESREALDEWRRFR